MSAKCMSGFILLTTLIAIILFSVGFAPVHWIKKDFVLPMPGNMLRQEDAKMNKTVNEKVDEGIKNTKLSALNFTHERRAILMTSVLLANYGVSVSGKEVTHFLNNKTNLETSKLICLLIGKFYFGFMDKAKAKSNTTDAEIISEILTKLKYPTNQILGLNMILPGLKNMTDFIHLAPMLSHLLSATHMSITEEERAKLTNLTAELQLPAFAFGLSVKLHALPKKGLSKMINDPKLQVILAVIPRILQQFDNFVAEGGNITLGLLPPQTKHLFKLQALSRAYAKIDKSTYHFNVSSNMNLFKSCKKMEGVVEGELIKKDDCGKKGARDWQKIAFGLGVAALTFAASDLIMSLLATVVERLKQNMNFRFAIVVINFCTAGLSVSPVIMYVVNNKIQVHPPLSFQVDYDLDWGMFVTAASSCVFALLVLLNVLHIVCFHDEKGKISDEPGVVFSKKMEHF